MWKYCDRISKWLFLILFLPFIHTFPFIYLFFLLVFPPPHTYPTISTYPSFSFSFSRSFRITCVVASRRRAYLHFSLSVSFSFFLFLLHKHTNFSPSISHKQILSHTHIDHRQRSGDWRSTQIGVLHFFIFFGLISFILLLRFH